MLNKQTDLVSKQAKALVVGVSSIARRTPKRLRKVSALVGYSLGRAKNKTARLVAKNPLRAILGFTAIGFVLAKLKRPA